MNMEKLNLNKDNLKKFGITMSIAFLVLTLLIFIRHKHGIWPTSIISGLFLAIGLIAPAYLKPVYIFWMRFAYLLGWVNTRLILTVIFYLVFTPVGIFMRLLGKDPLDRALDKKTASYWKEKEKKEFSPLNYTRQF